jgi:hypothetical protein
MARRKAEAVVIDHEETATEVKNQLAQTAQQASEHSQQIMDTYGDGLPYERSRIIGEARFYAAQGAEAVLEFGRRLLLLKEHEAHGDFTHIIDQQFGLHPRAAQRFMQGAVKYLSPKLAAKATALSHLGKTKLLELIGEDDEELAGLTEGGTIAGLSLDDIDRMSSRELRKALREAKADMEAKDQVITDKNKKMDSLNQKMKKIKTTAPDEVMAQYRSEANTYADQAEEMIRVQLTDAFNAVKTQADETGIDATDYLTSRLDLIDKAVLYLRSELGIERTADLTLKPEWEEPKE